MDGKDYVIEILTYFKEPIVTGIGIMIAFALGNNIIGLFRER
ncbi:hypothetical protein [Brevibacillus formosus]